MDLCEIKGSFVFFVLLWLPECGSIFLEVGLIRKFCWRDFAQKRWVVLQEMFVGGGARFAFFGGKGAVEFC